MNLFKKFINLFFSFKEQCIGISIDDDVIYAATLVKKKGHPSIKSLVAYPVQKAFPNVKPLYITTGLPPQDVIIKNILLNIRGRFSREKTLPIQAELATFIDKQQLFYETRAVPRTKNYTFHITAKNKITEHINILQKIGIDPARISSTQMALARFAHFLFFKHDLFVVVHITKKQTTYVLVNKGMPEISYNSSFNSKTLWNALKNDSPIEAINLLHFDASLFPNFAKELFQLKQETINALTYFQKEKNFEKIPLLISGNVHDFCFMGEFIKNASPLISETTLCSINVSFYAISIGLALESFYNDKLSLQFRKDEFISIPLVREYRKNFVAAVACLIAFFSLLQVTFGKILDCKEKSINRSLNSMLGFNNSSLNSSEKIHIIEKNINRDKKPLWTMIKNPKVIVLLNWLTAYYPKLQILSLEYDTLKQPFVENQHDKYAVKVILEVSLPEEIAQRFYRDIMRTKMVDHKYEIEWKQIESEKYKTSFFLNENVENI